LCPRDHERSRSDPGVRQVAVNLEDKSVRVDHDGRVSAERMMRAINAAGYDDVCVLI
jgi:copper chaperone